MSSEISRAPETYGDVASSSVPSPSVSLDPTPALLDPAVTPLRKAVAAHFSSLSPGDTVLVAVSGGADSLALAAVSFAIAPMYAVRVGAVIVDHGLFADSASVASAAAAVCSSIGMDPVVVERVAVDLSAGVGVEAAARAARYGALRTVASSVGAVQVLLGHTLNDQAETVLLGLARGAGSRSLAGMSSLDGLWGRPLLSVSRSDVRSAVAALLPGVSVWEDPANSDPSFLRSRVRNELMPVLESVLGPAAVASLARSADMFRADNVALEVWAQIAWEAAAVLDGVSASSAGDVAPGSVSSVVLAVSALTPLPDAVRRRVIRRAMLAAGVPGGSVSYEHLMAVDVLVTDWRGRGPVALPGAVSAERGKEALRIGK